MNEKEYLQLKENMGEMAKVALTFYRSTQAAGATVDESIYLTQAFITSIATVAAQLANGDS